MLVLARGIRGLSLLEVGQQSGIPLLMLYVYETGGGVLSESDLALLARGYGFPVAFFFRPGELHAPQFPPCFIRNPVEELLAPLQAMLDEIVGDDVIADVDLMPGGYYIHEFAYDGKHNPIFRRKLGSTERQAERSLQRALRLYRKTGVHARIKDIEGLKPRVRLKLAVKPAPPTYLRLMPNRVKE